MKVDVFVQMKLVQRGVPPSVYVTCWQPKDHDGWTTVKHLELEVPLAENELLDSTVVGLRKQLEEVRAAYQLRVQEINAQINTFLALEASA